MIPLVALALPLILWPAEMLVRTPLLWEETAKLALAIYMARLRTVKWYEVALVGGLFGLSEAALYLLNANFLGSLWPWVLRLLFTVPLHAATILTMYLVGRWGERKWSKRGYWRYSGWLGGWLVALAMHAAFNWWVR